MLSIEFIITSCKWIQIQIGKKIKKSEKASQPTDTAAAGRSLESKKKIYIIEK